MSERDPKTRDPIAAGRALAVIITGYFSLSIEVFLRWNFGERYFSVVRVFFGGLVMAVLAVFPFLGGGASKFYWGLAGCYLVLSIIHLVRIWLRNRAGVVWHSQSFGVPLLGYLLPGVNDWTLYRFIEPAISFALAVIASRFDRVTSNWLFLASVSLLVHNQMVYSEQRNRWLDAMDASIEAETFSNPSAFIGRRKQESHGFSTVSIPLGLDRNRDGIPDYAQAPNYADTVAETMGDRPAATRGAAAPARDYSTTVRETMGDDQDDPRRGSPPTGAAGGILAAVPVAGEMVREGLAQRPPTLTYIIGALLAVVLIGLVVWTLTRPSSQATAGPVLAFETVPPELATFTPVPTIDTRPTQAAVVPIALPGSVAQQPAPTVAPLTAPSPTVAPTAAEAVPGGDPSNPGQGSNPDMFAGSGTAIPTQRIEGVPPGATLYEVVAQTPKSTLRVLNAWQSPAGGLVLTVNYDALDSRKVGISAPGDPDAFYLLSGGERYPLESAANIAIGSTSQQVPVGGSLIFTLTFAPLDDPTQPFDLIEGEHSASASPSTSYWDIEGVQLKARKP